MVLLWFQQFIGAAEGSTMCALQSQSFSARMAAKTKSLPRRLIKEESDSEDADSDASVLSEQDLAKLLSDSTTINPKDGQHEVSDFITLLLAPGNSSYCIARVLTQTMILPRKVKKNKKMCPLRKWIGTLETSTEKKPNLY
jgi:hypothetical protein